MDGGNKKTGEGEEIIRRGKNKEKKDNKCEGRWSLKKETGEQRRRRRNWHGRTGPPNVVQEVLPDLRII